MHKDGKFSDNGRTRQKYCCPFKRSKSGFCPCNHKNWNNGKKCRGCTKYVTLPDDYRLSIDRECVSFKKIYALRTEAERYNARFKQMGQERLWVHGINATRNLNTIAHIALLDGLFSIFPPDFSFFRLRSALLYVFSLFYICCLAAGWHSYFSLTVLLLAKKPFNLHFYLLRITSYISTPAATDAFKELILPFIGSESMASHFCFTRRP